MTAPHRLLLVASCLYLRGCCASNWAQVTGPREQNIDINDYPSAAHPHWLPRYGHSVVTFSSTSVFNAAETVLLLGGDVYDGDALETQAIENLFDYRYGGGYKNDIWELSNVNWEVLPDQTGWLNDYG